MSEVIVRTEIPKWCIDCCVRWKCGRYMNELMKPDEERDLKAIKPQIGSKDCLVLGVLPETHGDLIDRDELKRKKVYSHERHEYVVPVAFIDWEHAVIEAERKDDE